MIADGPEEFKDTPEFYALALKFARSVQQTPGLNAALWGQPYDVNDFDHSNMKAGVEIYPSIYTVLNLIMGDISAFVAFAAQGAYSGPQPSYWSGDHVGVITPLTTYMVNFLVYPLYLQCLMRIARSAKLYHRTSSLRNPCQPSPRKHLCSIVTAPRPEISAKTPAPPCTTGARLPKGNIK